MDMKAVLDAMLSVAKAAAPLVGPAGPAAIELGTRVVEMIDTVKDQMEGGITPELIRSREDLDRRINQINADVDSTVARLRGEEG